MAGRWKKRAASILLSLRRIVLFFLGPITESREFKVLYPVLVVSLGAFAAFQAHRLRTLVVAVAFSVIAISSVLTIFLDTQKIRLECPWHLLLFSYYRPFLIVLTKRIARSLDRHEQLDILTYRTGDFIAALDEAAADFEQVSGSRTVNIASFDIEYVPVLKHGVTREGFQYKLLPFSDFWEGRDLYQLKARIPPEIRTSVLQLVDADHLYAIPVGWGLVGVAVIEKDLGDKAVLDELTSLYDGRRGFEFGKLFANISRLRELGYQVLCYDFWSSIGQLVLLNYTGHMGASAAEDSIVADAFQQIRTLLLPADIISDPLVLLNRVTTLDKCIVIGGSTWFGIKGTLLPIAIPDAAPAYGAFCECLGVVARPHAESSLPWDQDAHVLMSWLGDQLGDQRANSLVPRGRRSILQNYLPGLVRTGAIRSAGKETAIDLWAAQPMHIDRKARIIFRRFAADDVASISRLKDLWSNSRPGLRAAR